MKIKEINTSKMRTFESGATRDSDTDKLDYEGFLSPFVLKRYAEYLHKHRIQSDGKLRDSDNWTKGIPLSVYMKSMTRHFMEVWMDHKKSSTIYKAVRSTEEELDSLCALMFNVQGYIFEYLKSLGEI